MPFHRLGLGLALALAACGPSRSAPVANIAAGDAPAAAIEPVITVQHKSEQCPLEWSALDEVAPPTIALHPLPASPGAALPDDCPAGFDPATMLAHGCTDCAAGELAPGRRAVLQVEGPAGSGRFATLGLAVGGRQRGFACLTASTVGWRHLYRVGTMLAPLPWLAEVDDGDPGVELVAWHRLPWGDSEIANATVPVVYELDGDVLVRRDDRGRALAHRVAAAYAKLVAMAQADDPIACYRAVAAALERWGPAPR